MGKRRKQLESFKEGVGVLSQDIPKEIKAFFELHEICGEDGVLTHKFKELISVAISCYSRCEVCIVYHVYHALKAGATRKDILEAAMVAVVFGGGPSVAYAATVLKEALDEFEPDFK